MVVWRPENQPRCHSACCAELVFVSVFLPSFPTKNLEQRLTHTHTSLVANTHRHPPLKVSRGCGSTGVFALIEDIPDEKDAFNIITANVGDSRCVHTVGGSSDDIVETKDHKPGLPEERERIENAGGFINNDRVDGGLALRWGWEGGCGVRRSRTVCLINATNL